jgi:8-oxo-dGTP pyrophosphatase MutT (NUDIX family)
MNLFSPYKPQVAAIPIRDGRICLVSTSNSKKFTIPKGNIPTGVSPPVMAACEAWEEAGILGEVSNQHYCTYHYEKCGNMYRVKVYLLNVTRCLSEWPEKYKRQRVWLPISEGIESLDNKQLRMELKKLLASGVWDGLQKKAS